eukprot:13991_1
MSNENDLPNGFPSLGSSHSVYSRNCKRMRSTVREAFQAVSKRYIQKQQNNPIKPYQNNILDYFKQNKITGDLFHDMTKQQFIAALKRYVKPQEHAAVNTAFNILHSTIEWMLEMGKLKKTNSNASSAASTPTSTPATPTMGTYGRPYAYASRHTKRRSSILQLPSYADYAPDPVATPPKTSSIRPSVARKAAHKAAHKAPSNGKKHGTKKRVYISPTYIKSASAAPGGLDPLKDDLDDRQSRKQSLRIDTTPDTMNGRRGSRANRRISLATPGSSRLLKRSKSVGRRQALSDPRKYVKSNKIYEDIELKCPNIAEEMRRCNHDQFLYVVSSVIDTMNDEIMQSNDDAKLLYNKPLILGYLHDMDYMDGMFVSRAHDLFVHNVKQIVFDTKNENDFLTDRLKQQYAQRLYERIHSLDLKTIAIQPQYHISFNPSLAWCKSLRKSSFSIISTLNQYRTSALVRTSTHKSKVIDTLNECNDTISSMLCNTWTTRIKKEEQIWNYDIQSITDCTVLNMLYLIDYLLNRNRKSKQFKPLAPHLSKILEFFEDGNIDGKTIRDLMLSSGASNLIDALNRDIEQDLSRNIRALFDFILKLNIFEITVFHIKTDLKWDGSIGSIKQCTEKDILYLLIHLLPDPPLDKLLPLQCEIVEYFVRNKINGEMFGDMKEQVFADGWHKYIQMTQQYDRSRVCTYHDKKLLIKLFYAIKRCPIQDMTQISVEHEQSNTNLQKGVFTKWDRRTTFKNIKRVGYKCDEGVIAVADVITSDSIENKDKIQLSVKNIGSKKNSYLTEPFWLSLPNPKLCKPTKDAIEQSHYEVFNKWIMILRIKHKQNAAFEDNVFRDMAFVSQTHPQLIFTIKYCNYAVQLEDKTYDHVLQSMFACFLMMQCNRKRCYGYPKLDCHCDSNRFQTYTYCMMMAIMTEETNRKKNANDSLLATLQSHSHDTSEVVDRMCALLPKGYTEQATYIGKYRKHLQRWLLHDFYNTICSHCGSVNKSIMIHRVFHYSATLRNCRTCGVIGVTNEFKTEDAAFNPKAKSAPIDWFCDKFKSILEDKGIKSKHLNSSLKACKLKSKVSSPQHEESDLFDLVRSLLTEPFDELTYYLSRFLDRMHLLRIKIAADYYFNEYPEPFVTVDQFMSDAGIHPRHINTFTDCWNSAFPSATNNRSLINMLNEEKSAANTDVLCVNFGLLGAFKKLSPSISAFTTQFIQKFKEYAPKLLINSDVDLVHVVETLSDFKIDHNVFSLIDNEVQLLSLLWDKWEHTQHHPPIHSAIKQIKPLHDNLRTELLNELNDIAAGVDYVARKYADLAEQARALWLKQRKKKRSSKASKVKPQNLHAVLLFVEIPEIRDTIRRLLLETSVLDIHQRFGHLFTLLLETMRPLHSNESVYYSIDDDIILDRYRARAPIPIIGFNKPSAFNEPHNKVMTECKSSARIDYVNTYYLNVSALLSDHVPDNSNLEHHMYIFFGGSCIIEKDIHVDRQRLRKGSICRVYSKSKNKWFDGTIANVFIDDEGEWLDVHYAIESITNTKDMKRLDDGLLVTIRDKWDDLLQFFRGDVDMKRINAFLKQFINILKEHTDEIGPKLIFRVKTILTYYKKTLNTIPDFDLFLTETDITNPRANHITGENLEQFRKRYDEEMGKSLWRDHESNDTKTDKQDTVADKLYDVGIFMRYDVNNPRFESLAEETMFNEVVNISNARFNQHMMKAKEVYDERCFIMLSSADDFSFGIEKYQPISISHIIAVIIHTEEPNYSRAFIRSCLLLNHKDPDTVIQNHCNNFYWFGRYLFECIEYFGMILDEQSSTEQRQGLARTFKFDLFAPLINVPRSTTKSLKRAFDYAADRGCVLEFSPKYYGVLNSTKFINLKNISEDYDKDTRIFFGKRCAIQINNIWLSNRRPLQEFILPLLYLEKIMLQTIFDRQFYNAKHLYKDIHRSTVQMRLFYLLRSCTAITLFQQVNRHVIEVDKQTQMMIITRYFPSIPIEQHLEIRYIVNLLKHWCLQRTFITFESFQAELPFMVQPLRDYFVSRSNQIHIANLQFIMPNLKNYRNFNKRVVAVEPLKTEDHIVRAHSDSIIGTIDANLVDYYRAKNNLSYQRRKFRTWCNKNEYDDAYVEQILTSDFRYCNKHILKFDKTFFDLSDHVDSNYRHVWEVLRIATKDCLLKILYGDRKAIKELNAHLMSPDVDEKQHDASRLTLSRSVSFDLPKTNDAITKVLSNCQRHEIPDEICDILQNIDFKKGKNAKETKKEIAKWMNRGRNRLQLQKFYGPISKLHKATRGDFIKVAKEISLFDEDTMERLCDALMERLFADIERMKPWKCSACWFMNRKMMIGGLWCLYNQLNECGLCGTKRDSRRRRGSDADEKATTHHKSYDEPLSNTLQLPPQLKTKWDAIAKTSYGICTMDQAMYLEEFTLDHMNAFISNWLARNPKAKLGLHKNSITNYFANNKLDAKTYLNKSSKDRTQECVALLGETKLKAKLKRLHMALSGHIKTVAMDCKPMKRVAIILDHYHSLTDKLHTTNRRYPYSIRQCLSAFDTKDTRGQLLVDFEHILQHNPSIRAKQPYVAKCKKGKTCIHQKRIKQSQAMKLSQKQKQKLFNCDDWMDFEYILYLDKMHCAFFHNDDDALNTTHTLRHAKERHIIHRYSNFAVYSTGVYIDHSSLSPLHVNLKLELLNNSVYTVVERNWSDALKKAQDKLTNMTNDESAKWRATETNEIYGIRSGDRIQIEHVLVLYLYTSNSTLCTKFRESYRSGEYDDNNHHIRSYHINNFYWMGRFIYAAIQFFGHKPGNKDVFYHGLRRQFLFTEFSTIFEPPTSTTTDAYIAQTKFAGDNGIALTLKPKFKDELNNSKYLDVSSISDYAKEKERLFAGMTVLAVVDIHYRKGTAVTHLETYALVFLYFERIIEQTIHNKDYYNCGFATKKQQRKYLYNMIEHQMQRNGHKNRMHEGDEKTMDLETKEEYLYALFEHFCDSKQEYINLTCINDEIEGMDESIQNIFFKTAHKGSNKWEINDKNLQSIFPKLKGYKNHLGYWIHFEL